jgi:hypothetical protein
MATVRSRRWGSDVPEAHFFFLFFSGLLCLEAAARARAAARLLELGRQLQPPERVIPHALQHPSDRTERVPTRPIEALGLVGAALDQSGVDQRPKLQRDGAEGHIRHCACDVASGHFAIPGKTEDLAPPGGGDGGQCCGIELHVLILD